MDPVHLTAKQQRYFGRIANFTNDAVVITAVDDEKLYVEIVGIPGIGVWVDKEGEEVYG